MKKKQTKQEVNETRLKNGDTDWDCAVGFRIEGLERAKRDMDKAYELSMKMIEGEINLTLLPRTAIIKALLGEPLNKKEQDCLCHFFNEEAYKKIVELTGIEDIYDDDMHLAIYY